MKKLKVSNQRTCFITKLKTNKDNLIRVCLNKEKKITISNADKGRGVYFSKNEKIIPIILKKRSLNKAFKQNVDDKIYQNLISKIKEQKNEK